MTWEEIKAIPEGARVRVMVEGMMESHDPGKQLFVKLDRGSIITGFTADELTAPTARIEVLKAPVDPDVLAVREILAAIFAHPYMSQGYLDGQYDDEPCAVAALAAYRRVKG